VGIISISGSSKTTSLLDFKLCVSVAIAEKMLNGCGKMDSFLPKARGNKELRKHLMGDRLNKRQAILAKCADCQGLYADGRLDCQIPECPLYPFTPYGNHPVLPSDTPKKPHHGGFKKKIKAGISILEPNVPETSI